MYREGVLRHDTFIAACAKVGFTPDISLEAGAALHELLLVQLSDFAMGRLAQEQFAPFGGELSQDPGESMHAECGDKANRSRPAMTAITKTRT